MEWGPTTSLRSLMEMPMPFPCPPLSLATFSTASSSSSADKCASIVFFKAEIATPGNAASSGGTPSRASINRSAASSRHSSTGPLDDHLLSIDPAAIAGPQP